MIVPYVMPGFILAREIFKQTKNIDWNKYDGMILLNHGVFTFHDDAKVAYEKMIKIVEALDTQTPQVLIESKIVSVFGLFLARRPIIFPQISIFVSCLFR